MSNTNKSLLNENTVRRFMKLAEIDKLSDGFVDGLVQEVVEEQEPFEGEDLQDGPSGLEGVEGDEEVLDLDMDDEELEGPEEAPGEHVELADAIEQLMDVISAMTGAEIKVGPDTEPEDEDLGPEEEDLEAVMQEEDSLEEQEIESTPERERGATSLSTQPARPGRGGVGMTRTPSAQGATRHSGVRGEHPRFARAGQTAASREQEVATVPESYNRAAAYHQAAYHQAIHQENLQREAEYRHALKQEVLRRVTGRLQEENHKDAVADQLSERILKRIKNRSKK